MDSGGDANDNQFFCVEPYLSGVVYVSKSGNDANTGAADSPVLTIAQANTLAANTRITRIVVAGGTYSEQVTPPRANLVYDSQGATIDGAGTRNGFDVSVTGVTIRGFKFTNCVQGVYFKSGAHNGYAEDCENSLSTARGFYANAATGCHFIRCYSHDHTSGYGFEFEGGADNGGASYCWSTSGQHGFICKTSSGVTFTYCVAFDTTLAGFYSKGGVGMTVNQCVAYNTNYGVYLADNGGVAPNSSNATIKNTVIENAAWGIYAVAADDATGLVSDYNDFFGNTLLGVINVTTYAALANWQGAGYDAHSYAVDPAYASVVYGGFSLPANSALRGAGQNGANIGRDV